MNLQIIFLISRFIVLSIERVKIFPDPNVTSSHFFCSARKSPKPKYIQFTIMLDNKKN